MTEETSILDDIGNFISSAFSGGESTVAVTLDLLVSLFGSKNKETLAKFVDPLNKYMPLYGITTKEEVAHFLGETGHESTAFTRLSENLNYSAERLIEVFPRKFKSTDPVKDAELKKKAASIAGNKEATANYLYANILGNGNEASGDGFRYRGAGLIQLPGHDNHLLFAQDKGMDIKAVGDYARTPEGAVETACWFWKRNDIDRYVAAHDDRGEVKKINGGNLGLKERMDLANKALTLIA